MCVGQSRGEAYTFRGQSSTNEHIPEKTMTKITEIEQVSCEDQVPCWKLNIQDKNQERNVCTKVSEKEEKYGRK